MDKLKIPIKVKVIWDHPTECYVMYSKKYDITGYGPTKKKARKMLMFTILEVLKDTKPVNQNDFKKKKNDKSRKSSSRKLQKIK